jgi:hypothetical protein
LNLAQLKGLREAAETLGFAGSFAVIEGNRVHVFDIPRDRAELWRVLYFPKAKVVPMTDLFPEEPETVEGMTPAEFAALSPSEKETARGIDGLVSLSDPDVSEAEKDRSDDVCPCGDPDCSRPFGHPEDLSEADARSIKDDELYHEAKDEGRLRPRSPR